MNNHCMGKPLCCTPSDSALFAFGSANSTSPALLRSAQQGNVEILITVRLAGRDAKSLIPRLLDPRNSAERLVNASQLVSAPIGPEEDHGEEFPIEIIEAEADKQHILVWPAQPLTQSDLR